MLLFTLTTTEGGNEFVLELCVHSLANNTCQKQKQEEEPQQPHLPTTTSRLLQLLYLVQSNVFVVQPPIRFHCSFYHIIKKKTTATEQTDSTTIPIESSLFVLVFVSFLCFFNKGSPPTRVPTTTKEHQQQQHLCIFLSNSCSFGLVNLALVSEDPFDYHHQREINLLLQQQHQHSKNNRDYFHPVLLISITQLRATFVWIELICVISEIFRLCW